MDLTISYSLKRDMIIVILMWLMEFEGLSAAYNTSEYAWESDNDDYAGLAGLVANLASNYTI